MPSLIIAFILVAVLAGLGRRLLRAAGFSFPNPYEETVYSGGLGLGLASLVTLFLGLAGLLERPVFIGLFALTAVVAGRDSLALLRGLGRSLMRAARSRPSRVEWGLVGISAVLLLLDLVGALAPPNAIDSLIYHMAVPKQYVDSNRVFEIPYNIHSYLPFNMEMLYSVGLLLYNDVVAKLFHFFSGILIVLAILGLGIRYFNRTTALFAATIFLSLPLTTLLITTAHTDLGATLFFTLSLFALMTYFQRREARWALLAGVFAGLTVGTKLQPAFFVAALSAFYLGKLVFESQWRTRREYLHWGIFIAAIVLIGSPWFVKNLVYTGNPVFPHLYSVFGGDNWSPELASSLSTLLSSKAPGYDVVTFLKSPWRLTVDSASLGDLGFFFLAFLPFAFLLRERRHFVMNIALIGGIYYGLWFAFLFQRHRHWIELAPALAIVVAAVLLTLVRAGWLDRWAKRVLYVTVVGGLVAGIGITAAYNSKFFPVTFGVESRDEFLVENGYIYEPYVYAAENLPSTAKILAYNVWDMNYYLDTAFVIGNPLIQGYVDYGPMETGEDLLARLEELGVTHLFLRGDPPGDVVLPELSDDPTERSIDLYTEMASKYAVEIERFTGVMIESRTLDKNRSPYSLGLYELIFPADREQGARSAGGKSLLDVAAGARDAVAPRSKTS